MHTDALASQMLDIASSTRPLMERAQDLLQNLDAWLPVEGTRLALSDPQSNVYATVGGTGPDGPVLDHLDRPSSGYLEGIGVPLHEPGGFYVGMLTLLFSESRPPPPEVLEVISGLAPVIARGVSPMRS